MVEDVAFVDNVVRHSGAGVNILGIDDNQRAGSARTRRVMLHNNLFVDFGSGWGGNGTWLQILNGTTDVIIENNTALQSGNVITADGAPHQRFVFRANISVHNDYGIVGTGTGPGASTLNAYFPGAVVKDNVFIGGDPASYPRGNLFAPSLEQVFADSSFLAPQARYSGAGARGLAGLETLP